MPRLFSSATRRIDSVDTTAKTTAHDSTVPPKCPCRTAPIGAGAAGLDSAWTSAQNDSPCTARNSTPTT